MLAVHFEMLTVHFEMSAQEQKKKHKYCRILSKQLLQKWKMLHIKIFMGTKMSTQKKKIECVCHVQDIFLKKCSEQFWKHLWCIELAVVLPCSLVIPFSSFEHVRYGAGATQHTQLLWRLSSVGNLAWLVPQRTGELQDLLSLRFQVSYSVPIAVELLNSHVPHILK